MKNYKFIAIFIILGVILLPSCKKAGKELAERVTKESAEKTAKAVVTETSEKTLKTLTKKELRNLDWRAFLKLLKKENLNLAEALSKIDGGLQKKIGKAITSDYDFYSALISSHSIVDEFIVFTNKAPKAAKDINLFKYFVKARDMERRFGVPNSVSAITIAEDMGVIKLLNKTDGKVVGEYKDGVIILKDFLHSNGDLLDKNSLLKKTLIPNSVYRIKGANGLSFLYHVDDLGRFSKIETKGINADQLASNVVYAKENLKLGNDWNSLLKKVRQSSQGNDIDASFVFKYADDGTTPLAVKADVTVKNEKMISQSFENIDEVVQKAKKSKPKVIKSVEGEAAIKELSQGKNKAILDVIEKLEKNYGELLSKKNIVVEKLADGSFDIYYKGSTPGSITKINMKGNRIKAKGGSLVGENGAQNQFLNNVLPNMVYEVDDFVTYKTDNLDRVIEVVADRSKLDRANITRAGRASETQAAIRKNYPEHDGGHLVDCASGGANEMINQVPMEKQFNRNGAWKKMEQMEIKATKEGKDVKVTRKVIYEDGTTRPAKFISEIEIDGKKEIIELVNPMPS